MIIMALWASASHGKTTTLDIVLKKIVADGNFVPTDTDKVEEGEGAFLFGEKKIAITTAGDSRTILEKFFGKYPNYDLYLCACREKGQTVTYLKEKAAGNELFWCGKTTLYRNDREEESLKEKFKELNEAQAEYLYDEIKRIMEVS